MNLKLLLIFLLWGFILVIVQGETSGCSGAKKAAENLGEGLGIAVYCGGIDDPTIAGRNIDEINDQDVVCCRELARNVEDIDTNDNDGDNLINGCDPNSGDEDYDNDGILDGDDNCPLTANPDQVLPSGLTEEEASPAQIGEACF